MLDKVIRQSDEMYGQALATILQSARSIWGLVAEALVQAVLHYHEHGKDASRPQRLYVTLVEAGLGSQQAAVQEVLRLTTAITGIGGDADWKGQGVGRTIPENWAEVIEKIANGGGGALMAYHGASKPKKGEKSEAKKAHTLKLPESAQASDVGAVQKFLDSKGPAGLAKIVRGIENQGTEFRDVEAQAAFEEFLAVAHELESFAGKGTAAGPKGGKEETAQGKLVRLFKFAKGLGLEMVGDFERKVASTLAGVKEEALKGAESTATGEAKAA